MQKLKLKLKKKSKCSQDVPHNTEFVVNMLTYVMIINNIFDDQYIVF